MKITILANDSQKEELLIKAIKSKVEYIFIESLSNLSDHKSDVYFVLNRTLNKEHYPLFENKPVFINAVNETLAEAKMPSNFHRINAWPTFLDRNIWEVATSNETEVGIMFNSIGYKYIIVKDEPGLISARVISMIINEAYFAFEENVSTKEEINIAMKLGTNYPYGPFDWADKIGIYNIYSLLQKLSKNSRRYLISASLSSEALLSTYC